jgi:hypothetical protein
VDTLVVLDPDKTGSALFHYFTNGIGLVHRNGRVKSIGADLTGFVQRPEGGKNLDSAWLTGLSPGSSMEQTVELPMNSQINPGTYQASFRFPSPDVKNIQETHLPAGRLWQGEVDAKLTVGSSHHSRRSGGGPGWQSRGRSAYRV